MNAHGRRFVRGKALEDELRSVIVDTIQGVIKKKVIEL